MRRFLTLVLVVAMATPAPASAGEPSGAEETTPLAALVAEVEREIAMFEAASDGPDATLPFPGVALSARFQAKAARTDYFIGGVRARAHDRLHAVLDGVVLEAIHFITGEFDAEAALAAFEEAGATPLDLWEMGDVLIHWLALQDRVAELRALVEPGLPERVCPVEGLTWFRDEWQFPRPWGRIHKGVDMHTELGQVLVAVEDGVVIQANWHWQGGRQVWFRGDSTGDVYYYAHLEYWPRWLWTGTRLQAGDYLGLAGMSGNADTPHLHFGWMPGSGEVDLENLQNAYPLMYELCQ